MSFLMLDSGSRLKAIVIDEVYLQSHMLEEIKGIKSMPFNFTKSLVNFFKIRNRITFSKPPNMI